jgi:hypothetical protein
LHVARLGAPRCVYHLPHLHSFNNQASTSLTAFTQTTLINLSEQV